MKLKLNAEQSGILMDCLKKGYAQSQSGDEIHLTKITSNGYKLIRLYACDMDGGEGLIVIGGDEENVGFEGLKEII